MHELIQAKRTLDIMDAAVNALEHKKKALENLTQLEGRSYFSSPKAPEQSRERLEDKSKQHSRNKSGKRLNERN